LSVRNLKGIFYCVSSMEARLRAFLDFLNRTRVKEDEVFTHVSKLGPHEGWYPGRYYIGRENKEEFEKRYQDLVRRRVRMTLAEKPEKYGPLRVDADFKADAEVGLKRQYARSTLVKLVKIYQEEIRKIVDPVGFEPKTLWCVVLEKESPRQEEEGIIKDGFHLHFPHFICDAWVQDIHLRDRVTKRMTQEGVWSQCKFITDFDGLLDRGIARKPWMMYGSMNYKGEKSTPYMYSSKVGVVFDDQQKEISLGQLFEEEMIGRRHRVDYYLPVLLGIRGFRDKTPLLENVINNVRAYHKRRKPQIIRTRPETEILQDIKDLKDNEIIDLLSRKRADNYHDWMRVGWALFNVGQGHEEALQLWIEFSQKSDKFIEGECLRVGENALAGQCA